MDCYTIMLMWPSSFLPQPSQLLFRAAEHLAHVRPTHFDLAGKTALITGGSRGLGLELARLLVAKRAHLALIARDPDELERALADLRRARTSDSVRLMGHI